MDISKADLNLLVVFDAMLVHQSVTRAGNAIGLSQPAMSAAVAKLRTLFNDPLFVRTSSGMSPTALAAELAGPVHQVLDTVKSDILQKSTFNPARTERGFGLITPDIGEFALLPKIFTRLAIDAPRTKLRAMSMPATATAQALEAGEADLALGYFPDLTGAGFYQQRLFRNAYICMVRADHPGIGARLSLRQFMEGAHAVVRPEGRNHIFEVFLQQRGIVRDVRLNIAHFTSLLAIIVESDLIATVPLDIGVAFARLARIRLLDPPLKPPAFDVKQYWHRRYNKDPANIWLRRTVHELFSDYTERTARELAKLRRA
jgi:DNA-binding transcriptional LysR family regulator